MSERCPFEPGFLLLTDPVVRFPGVQAFWHDVHALLNAGDESPERIIERVLEATGRALGADRAYTFAVAADRAHTSCTYEWTSRPELALKHALQNIDQKGLRGWLDRFNSSEAIVIEDVDDPPEDLRSPAAKFKRDAIRSIYVNGFFDEGDLVGYLGVDYVDRAVVLDQLARDILMQLASTLNLFILRHEALELWNSTAREMPCSLFIKDVDNDLRYVYANPRYLEIFGPDIIGMNDIEAFGEDVGATFRAQDLKCLASRIPVVTDGPQLFDRKNPLGYYSLVKFPVLTKMGRHYIAGFIMDIDTEHRLRIQAQELLEKAQAAERAKSLFLAAMSHEIRTPLNAIIGLVDELRHDDVPDGLRGEYLSSVQTASHSLLGLVNNILDMSKLEAGKMPLAPEEISLADLFSECEGVFSASCRARGISLSFDLPDDCPRLVIDAVRVKQILFNLIANAVKFTQEGGISVRGAFRPDSARAGTLTLDVSDTGIGISPEDQKIVFGLFEQAPTIRNTHVANRGTGLGLSLSRSLAERLGGTLTLRSEIGRGSTFTVTLRDVPFTAPVAPSAGPSAACAVPCVWSPAALRGRVLIVDDEPLNLEVLAVILRRIGVDAVSAGGGAEALARVAEGGVSHVFSDLWMPEVNGEDLARGIRALPGGREIRIAAQTADVEAASNFDASLFDAILSKPITAEKVVAFLRK